MENEDITLTIDNKVDLKITKEGKIQIRAKKGMTTLDLGNSTSFTTTSTSYVDVASFGEMKNLESILGTRKMDEIKQILNTVQVLKKTLDAQNEFMMKINAIISKMYQDNEINKDTFNKLDSFLKEYHDNPYQDGNY